MKKAFITFFKALLNLIKVLAIALKRKLTFKEIFQIKHLFEIIGAYFLIIISFILLYCEVPYARAGNTTVAIYGTQSRIGESTLYDRIKRGAENNGWNVIGVCFPEGLADNIMTGHFCYNAMSLLNIIFKPKFNLATTHHVKILPYGYNITYLNMPNEGLISFKGNFKSLFSHLGRYDAYVDIHSVFNGTNPTLNEALKINNNQHAPQIPLYFAENHTTYTPTQYKQVIVVGSLWGCNRESLRVMNAVKKLAKENLLVAYGLKPCFECLGPAYKGRIEEQEQMKSAKVDTLTHLQRKTGISLVLHNLEHMLAGIPTNRIAESIAAGAIVICDENLFVKKYFGDTVLYIDALAQSDSIYKQIRQHVTWIQNNPAEAEKKARAAFDILMREFAIENSLKKLLNFVNDNQRKSKI